MSRNAQKRSPCPPLAPHVEMTIAALAEDGITPTPAEIAWLAKLRDPCERISDSGELPPMWGAPVEVAGDLYWPLHPLAMQWFRRSWVLLAAEDGDWQTWAYMFAHTRAAPGDKSLTLLQTRDSIKAAVGEWRQNAPLHEDLELEFVRFLRRLDGLTTDVPEMREEDSSRGVQPSCASGVAALCRLFPGTTPEYWQSEISEKDRDSLLADTHEGDYATSPTRKRHIENYLRAVKWIRFSHARN